MPCLKNSVFYRIGNRPVESDNSGVSRDPEETGTRQVIWSEGWAGALYTHHQDKLWAFDGSLLILRVHIPHLVMLHWAVYQVIYKATTGCDGPPEIEWPAVSTGCKASSLVLWPSRSSGVQSPLANKDPGYMLWQTSIRESQHWALWFWREAMLFLTTAILSLLSPASGSEGTSCALRSLPSHRKQRFLLIGKDNGLFPCMPSLKYSQIVN